MTPYSMVLFWSGPNKGHKITAKQASTNMHKETAVFSFWQQYNLDRLSAVVDQIYSLHHLLQPQLVCDNILGGREGGREGGRMGGREGGRQGRRERGRKEGREGGRERGRQGGREGGREGGRKERREGMEGGETKGGGGGKVEGGRRRKGKRIDWAQQLLRTCQLPLTVSETH